MYTPTYGGLPIFGGSAIVATLDNPRAEDIQRIFGADGLVLLDGGARGRFTFASGFVFAVSRVALADVRAVAMGLNDGGCRVLVDTDGTAWPQVQLESWRLVGRLMVTHDGRYFSAFRARLLHLV